MNPSLARLVDALSPGATPVSLRRLRGGLGAHMHRLRYETPDGERRNVVLRRYVVKWSESTPEHARYEFGVLQLLEQAGIAAPRPLLLDAGGTFFGGPALVLSYIPGRSFVHHADEGAWVDGLARALAAVHAVTPERYNLTSLRDRGWTRERLDEDEARLAATGPLALAAQATLVARFDTHQPVQPCLTHDDYWPGNTVWYRGRLAAVIDWSSAGLGDPRADVAQCRADLVFSNGLDAADAFLRRYEAVAPRPVPDLWYYDLLLGLRALLNHEKWLAGYHDAGMRHLQLADVGARIEAFVRRALDEAP